MSIPLVDLVAQFAEIRTEVDAGIDRILSTGAFIGGAAVADFERAYAAATGTRYCVGVGNGTDAIELALRGVGVGPGDEVVMPVNTFVATAEAAARIGAVPVFVDVEPDTLLVDPALANKALTARTRAVVPVHLFGQLAKVEEIVDLGVGDDLPIVEDAAQSHGATRHGRVSGSLGTVAATSFYPGKNLGAAGDGGAVTTDDGDLAERVRVLANHGSAHKYDHEVVGVNSRLDAIQAVVLAAKLSRLEAWNERRRGAADRYLELLGNVDAVRLPVIAEGNVHAWHLFVVRVADRDRVLAALASAGIGAGIHYPTPLSLTGAFAHLGHRPGDFPVAEAAAAEMISLPIYPHITPEQQEQVVTTLVSAVG